MPKQGGLQSFFAIPNRANKDDEPDASPSTKKRKVTNGVAAATSHSWAAADERAQIDRAIKLSLASMPGAVPGNETSESSSSSVDATSETQGEIPVAVPPTAEMSEPKQPLTTTSTVAPLFKTKQKQENEASTATSASRVTPRPTLTDGDFQGFETATKLHRFEGSLDCLFWPRWMSASSRESLRQWMLSELAWHRVSYIRPGGMRINTPRFTTTFGIDDTGSPANAYQAKPKPIPPVLAQLKERIEAMQNAEAAADSKQDESTAVRYNALIINYYATGDDSISYHSDDEAFLGVNPNIASLSLGATRDFYLRRKAPVGVVVPAATSASGSKGSGKAATRPTEQMQLLDGSLLIMRGKTQAEWEHSIPKRKNVNQGRINITFRKAISPKAINNFINYNRGKGPTYRYRNGQMVEAHGGI